ncbi:hypothetical protein GCM10025771_08140 [Niveibacterium umoris]|uniref:HNH nuclease domain-containing protein n=1 Tax=Niveibacterium umoris TaxID=1193620 RepID=A0A840BQ91_9RHOO|nr:HNH endonuclease [Niveibacterium umoris]MBB4013639.1 hypothetical protein [Niveibacterium umoris]
MTPLDRLRLEKAAADCGFEMQPRCLDDGLEMCSARFPETVIVRQTGPSSFLLVPSTPVLLGRSEDEGPVSVAGFNELYRILRTTAAHARTLPNRIADAFRAQTAKLPTATEAERLVVQRVGQGMFRDALLDYWQGACCVTGLAVPHLLRASHIKPWAKCDNDDERLDVFNGLLLAPHVDALFDGGWISFAENGDVVISDALPPAARVQLGVSADWQVNGLRDSHLHYLAFHRENELRRSG